MCQPRRQWLVVHTTQYPYPRSSNSLRPFFPTRNAIFPNLAPCDVVEQYTWTQMLGAHEVSKKLARICQASSSLPNVHPFLKLLFPFSCQFRSGDISPHATMLIHTILA